MSDWGGGGGIIVLVTQNIGGGHIPPVPPQFLHLCLIEGVNGGVMKGGKRGGVY